MADSYQRMTSSGAAAEIPVLTYVPPKPRCPKIELEAAFVTSHATPTLQDGSPDLDWLMTENGLCRGHVEAVMPRLQDFETTRMQIMKDNDVQLCLNANVDPGIQTFANPKEAAERAVKTNNYLAEQCKKSGGRFGGWTHVSLHDCEQAAEEIRRCVKEHNFVGVLVNGFQVTEDENEVIYLDDERCDPLWKCITELDVPLYIHPRVSHERIMYKNHPYMQGAMWGFALETGTHLLRLVYSGIFDKYPTARVAVGHMGECVPYMAWRVQHYFEYNPFGKSTKLTLQQYLGRNIWITTSGNYDTQALQLCINVMGADRIMWSIDYPFENPKWAADWIDSAPIAESTKRMICYENALKFLGKGLKDFKIDL